MKKMSESKKKRMLKWLDKQSKKNKGRKKKTAMTNSCGRIIKLK